MRRACVVVLPFLFVAASAFAATTPVILSIDPTSVVAGSASFTMIVNGANFVTGAQVRFNGSTLSTTLVSSSQLTAIVPSTRILNAGTINVTATNPGSTASGAVTFTVLPNDPQITALDPASIAQNTPAPVTVKVNGQNFASTAIVRVNNQNHTTTFVNDTQLTFTLSAAEVSIIGNLNVNVSNPQAKLSNTVQLPITNGTAAPTITLLSPQTINAGAATFTLTVVGTNYVSNSIIRVNSVARTTHFVDSSHLTTTINASDVNKAGTLTIAVANPNNVVSGNATLTITNGTAPTITSISPQSVTAGAQAFTLSIIGTNFTTGATVKVGNAAPRNATFVDAQHVTAPIVAADVVSPGQVSITVTTPAPNGGTSNAATLTVVSQFAPKVTSMTPTTVPAGSATFKLLITGTNFKIDDIVQLNGATIATEFISITQIAGTVTSDKVTAAGTALVTVTRKDGSGTSAPLTLTITGADAPLISSLSPQTGDVGGTPFTLVITGKNFVQGSVVTVDADPRDTTFVSTTTLTISITATDLATAHDAQT